MHTPAKLVRQIREAFSEEDRNAPFESLAAEYAQLCQEASQRLESCAAMLEKGSEYQALQLAETEPVLLDLIATLSFAEAPEWTAFCVTNRLPAAPRFEPKAVQLLDAVYARGISANHPLYKDYRAAVTSRDDMKAMRIIRSIVRMNPHDANAASELRRMGNKLFQIELQQLREALEQEDENAILPALAELERLATPERLAELPDYASAVAVRAKAARREAIAVAARLVESLAEERQAGAWRMVGDILARLRALQAEHGFALDEEQAANCAEMQQYFEAQRAAADETARFEQALAMLGSQADSVEARLLATSTLTLGEAQDLQAEFSSRRREVEGFQRPVPAPLDERVRAVAEALQTRVVRLRRRRQLRLGAAGAALLLAIGTTAWLAFGAMRAKEYAAELAGLRSAGQVEAAEKMIARVREKNAALAVQPQLAARLDETERWTRDERAKQEDIEKRLTELETTARDGLPEAGAIALAAKLESAGLLLKSLAGGLRTGPASRLLVLRNQFDGTVAVLREKLIAQTDGELTALETLAGAKLGYDQPKEVIAKAVEELEPALKLLEGRMKPAVAALELPPSQQARASALRQRLELFHEELETLSRIHEALLQATTLEAFLEALSGYKESKLAQSPEVADARKLLASFPKPDALLASLLLPGDAAGWAAAKADAGGEALAPATVLPAEIGTLAGLRDDNYLNDIWEMTFADYHRKGERRVLYSRGDLSKEGADDGGGTQTVRWTGAICDPSLKTEIPAFVPGTISMQHSTYGSGGDGEISAKHLSAVSECLVRLELNRMTDDDGSKFERPLLQVFDGLVREKSANAIFKAYLMQQLGSVLMMRPEAWGLEYCASLRADLAELGRLCNNTPLRSQDWLLERKRTQLGAKLAAFFDGLQNRNYLAEARLHRTVLLAVVKAGLQFGGFIDSAGQAHLLGEARGAKPLWSLAADGQKLARYLPTEETNPPAKLPLPGFSPVFFVPLDRETVLAEAASHSSSPSGAQVMQTGIPWLENP